MARANVCNFRNPCDFAVNGSVSCTTGPGSCGLGRLLEAEESEFHDECLIKATQQINQLLADLPADPNGRQLSFLHTRLGTMLAWVRHGVGEIPPGAVTAKDDDATLVRALRLKELDTADAAQA